MSACAVSITAFSFLSMSKTKISGRGQHTSPWRVSDLEPRSNMPGFQADMLDEKKDVVRAAADASRQPIAKEQISKQEFSAALDVLAERTRAASSSQARG